ncbi:deSI-like protein [Carex littledalei]|uniref:DeSI-like protein n=1 Tax=Carex littledalei TaxID=544730 RepID=A0A833QUN4_9POAL|nr:deSI-like protein [Carex littledalei]
MCHVNEDYLILTCPSEILRKNNGALCNCLLPESMRVPVAVKQISDYPGFSEDGSESCSMLTTTTTTATHEQFQFESDDTDQDKHLLSQ